MEDDATRSLLQTGRIRTAASNRAEAVCKEMVAFCSWLHREHPTQQAQVLDLLVLSREYIIQGLYRDYIPLFPTCVFHTLPSVVGSKSP